MTEMARSAREPVARGAGEAAGAAPRRLSLGKAAGLALAHALLFFAAFHPLGLFPLAWVALVPLALLVARGSAAQAYLGSLAATFLGGGLAVSWLTLFGGAPWAATALGFGLYGMLMTALARPLSRALPAALWLPLVLVAQEYLRGHLFFFAFPWIFLGHSQHPLGPLVQAADLGGAALISFLVAAGNGVVLDHLLGAPRKVVLRRAAIVLGAGVALATYGAIRERTLEVIEGGPRVLVVQANIPQKLKEEGGGRRKDLLQAHRMLSLDGAKGLEVDLVVWPETMVLPEWHIRGRPWPYDPGLPYAALDLSWPIRSWLAQVCEFASAHMIAGSMHAEIRAGELVEHNSAFFLDEKGQVVGRYDKMFPAPMSENTPFYEAWPAAYRFLRETFVPPGFSQFEPGKDVPVWEVKGWKFGASVCFDITFPEASNLAARKGADVIVNVSNYGWFLDSAELDLARVQTIFRAIETRRGVVAACNGGISSVIDPRGRAEDIWGVSAETGERTRKLVEGTLVAPVSTTRARTLFVLLGDWVGAGSAAFAIALAVLFRALERRRARGNEGEGGAAR